MEKTVSDTGQSLFFKCIFTLTGKEEYMFVKYMYDNIMKVIKETIQHIKSI
jgi:hypothetical protein